MRVYRVRVVANPVAPKINERIWNSDRNYRVQLTMGFYISKGNEYYGVRHPVDYGLWASTIAAISP